MDHPKGVITLELEGLPPEEIERIRSVVHVLIASRAIMAKGVKVTLHFDGDGNLSMIEGPLYRRTKVQGTIQSELAKIERRDIIN